jgi:ketosteroid isomerase-like protein
MIRAMILVWACLCVASCGGPGKEAHLEESKENIAAISALREAYAAFNRGDIEKALEPFDEQIGWSEPAEFQGAGTYHGRDGVRRYLTQSRAALAEGSSEPERFITSGNRIVVFVHARVRSVGSEEWHDIRLADVYTMQNGKAIQMRAFADRNEALRWAGVENGVR